MATRRALFLSALATALALSSCADAPPPVKPPAIARQRSTPPRHAPLPKLPEWTYWQPVDAPVTVSNSGPELPLGDAQIVRPAGAEQRWDEVKPAGREELRKQGFVEIDAAKGSHLGKLYTELRDARVPMVITLDALLVLGHVALDRAVAEIEQKKIAPALQAVLPRLEARLFTESKDARADLAPASLLARGLVATAAALASPQYKAPRELEGVVAKETAKVRAHAGPSESPLLGVTIDYSAMAPRGMADGDETASRAFRAAAWLEEAPLMLAGTGEAGGPRKLSVAAARTQTRAALLLTRLLDPGVDAEVGAAWGRVTRLCEFIGGPADDVTYEELAKVAAGQGADMKDARWIADVARLDKLRHAAAQAHATRLYDGNAASVPRHGGPRLPAAISARLLGGRATPDADFLQELVFPFVGAQEPGRSASLTGRDGVRALPTALDVGAWLGSADARIALHDAGDDAYAGYEAAFARLVSARAPDGDVSRHASLYASALDAIATYLAPSAADGVAGPAQSLSWRAHKLESALAAWTLLRHDALGFSRLPMANEPPVLGAKDDGGAGAVVFVEPHPEAIAQLLALVRQASRGLFALGGLEKASPAAAVLTEVEDIFSVALSAALRQANDEGASAAESAALSHLPARIAALDAALEKTGATDVAVVADVHVDVPGGRVLEEATGALREVVLTLVEPGTHRLVLAAGASLSHYELVQPLAERLSDTTWRAKLSAAPPERDAFTKKYVSPTP